MRLLRIIPGSLARRSDTADPRCAIACGDLRRWGTRRLQRRTCLLQSVWWPSAHHSPASHRLLSHPPSRFSNSFAASLGNQNLSLLFTYFSFVYLSGNRNPFGFNKRLKVTICAVGGIACVHGDHAPSSRNVVRSRPCRELLFAIINFGFLLSVERSRCFSLFLCLHRATACQRKGHSADDHSPLEHVPPRPQRHPQSHRSERTAQRPLSVVASRDTGLRYCPCVQYTKGVHKRRQESAKDQLDQ